MPDSGPLTATFFRFCFFEWGETVQKPEDQNRGAISRNKRRTKDSQPDYTGDATINGTEFWISGWLQDGKNGKFLSLAFRSKNVSQESASYDEDAALIARLRKISAPDANVWGSSGNEELSPWEMNFAKDIASSERRMTGQQREMARKIIDKVERTLKSRLSW